MALVERKANNNKMTSTNMVFVQNIHIECSRMFKNNGGDFWNKIMFGMLQFFVCKSFMLRKM